MSKKKRKKSIFSRCFSCFSTVPIECDELICSRYVTDISDITDFEYIVENMSIKRIPKKFLNETLVLTKGVKKKVDNDFSGYVVKEVPPKTSIGPVIKAEDASFEGSSSDNFSKGRKPTHWAAPVCMTCDTHNPPHKRPGISQTFHAQTKHLLDKTIKELLTPHSKLNQDDESQKEKVFADIHQPNVEEDGTKYVQIIPPEIKETIEALKVARPLHTNSKLSPTNHRSLIRSSSNTSCDKETFYNLSDEKCIIDDENSQRKVKRRYIPPDKMNASSSTSDFQDSTEFNKNTSSDLQSSEKVEAIDSQQGQSLKWKIIINKHKEDMAE